MNEVVGIKETKEALVGFLKLTSLMAASFKDGIQAQDISVIFAKILENPELKQALLDAYNGVDQIPSEIKDLNFAEGIELVTASLPEIVKIVSGLKA